MGRFESFIRKINFFALFVQMLVGVRFFFIFNCPLQIEFFSQLISEYWNQTTTLIPFLQAKHFCNFIPSNFMEGFAFLIDDTSYIGPNNIGLASLLI